MDPGRFGRLRELVLTAVALPEQRRESYLDQACAGDDALRREAASLLDHGARTPTVARTSGMEDLLDGLRIAGPDPLSDRLPDHIGPYRVVGILGQGGMGTVYRAEQMEPIRREVAVKLIRYGADSAAVLARFESERQTLALMDHSNIARVLDAGSDEQSRPFFVMEVIHGMPITTYCRASEATLRERLTLWLDVCRAVAHAHLKGVIHRDLKPSNVLVAASEEGPIPKVIDFSVAKSLGDSTLGTEFRTRTGQVVGTLEYMSPEQAQGAVGRIDVRSDVYSLGVLAYELFTGRLPHETRGLAFHEAVRRIVEDPHEPLRATGSTATGSSRIDPDVETIVDKCLEKEPERRYGGAGELVEDIERYLDSRPILARPPSTTYQLRMLVRRHRGAVLAALAILAVLVGGIAGTGTALMRARQSAREARTQAALAKAVNRFLNEDLLSAANPGVEGKDATIGEVLDIARERIRGRLESQPLAEAEIRNTIGATYRNLGRYDDAAAEYEVAVELRNEMLGADSPVTLITLKELGWVMVNQGRIEAAEATLLRATEGLRRALGPEHRDTLRAINNLAVVKWKLGEVAEAERLHREALAIKVDTLGEHHTETLASKTNLGILLASTGRLDEAEPFLEDVVEGRMQNGGPDDPATLTACHNLAKLYLASGRTERGESLFLDVVARRRRVLGEEHPRTLESIHELAEHYVQEGRFDDAEQILREAFEARKAVLGPEHPDTQFALGLLNRVREQAGQARQP